jgi:DNA-binding NarL/FixJ family response regulator
VKVLVIDGAPAVRSRLVALLAERELTVVGEFASANLARAFVRTSPPDAVVLDVDLPDRGGLALMEDLRRLAPRAALVILTNALSYRRRCVTLGVDAFLDKSVDFATVADTLVALCKGSPSAIAE